MKIAHVINTLSGGGAERVAIGIYNCLRDYQESFIIAKNIISYSIDFEPIILQDIKKKPFYMPAFLYERKLINTLANTLKDFDVVISHLRDMNTRLCYLKKEGRLNSKLIIIEHVTKDLYSEKELALVKNLYKYADISIGVSQKVVENLKEYGAENIYLIENFVDNENIKKLASEKDIKFDRFSVLSMGRLSEDKDFITLLKAIKLSNIEVNLYILGEGSMKNKLMDLAKSLGLEKKVHFLGFKENPFPYIRACDVFVSSSIRESFSLATLEAMSLGKAVVCTDVIPFAKDGENALVVPVKNEHKLAEAIRKIYEDKELREKLSKNALDLAQSYDISHFCMKYRNLISEI